MSNRIPKPPAYCRHAATGLAFVKLAGKFIYLGPYGSLDSKAAYERRVTEWRAGGRAFVHATRNRRRAGWSVNELLVAYWQFAQGFYARPSDGAAGTELEKVRHSIVLLKDLYGTTPAADFGPVALKAIRQRMIERGLARTTVNQRIRCIRRVFKWAVSEELVPAGVLHALLSVDGLRRGRCAAREPKPVRPVPDAHVDAVLPFLCPTVRAMVELQRHTGMRSGELCLLRACDIDCCGDVWVFRPPVHKTSHLAHNRSVQIGPRAQEIIRPLLANGAAYLFSPALAQKERQAERRAARKSKVQPSQRCRAKRDARRRAGDRYDTKSYYRAVRYGITRAIREGVLGDGARWHPHQLRHACATTVRKQFGLDAARAILGQRSLAMADTYAEIDEALASRVAAQFG